MKTLFVTVTHNVPHFTRSRIQLWDVDDARPIADKILHPPVDNATVAFGDLNTALLGLAVAHDARLISVQDSGIYIIAQPTPAPLPGMRNAGGVNNS